MKDLMTAAAITTAEFARNAETHECERSVKPTAQTLLAGFVAMRSWKLFESALVDH